jgi:hypothetical protein
MNMRRRLTPLALAFALAAGVSCATSDSGTPFAPSSEPAVSTSFGVLSTSTATELLTCSTQRYVITSKTIGPEGGEIKVGRHRLEIPKKALTQKTKITAEQLPGSSNSVRFGPEGLHFLKAAELTLSYDNCSKLRIKKKIVYTTEALSILELLKSNDYPKYEYVSSPIDHFSRYAVAY